MKLLLFLVLVSFIIYLTTADQAEELDKVNKDSNFTDLWKIYKKQYDKSYSESEDAMRYKLFVETVNVIIAHNMRYDQGEVSFKMGINQFTDLYPEERPGGRISVVKLA